METDDFPSVDSTPSAVLAPALTILYHPDLRRIGDRALLGDFEPGATAALSRDTPDFVEPRGMRMLPLADSCISRTPVLLSRGADGSVRLRREESRTRILHRGQPVEADLDVSPGAPCSRSAAVSCSSCTAPGHTPWSARRISGWWARARASSGCAPTSSTSPTSTSPCSCAARPAPARSWSPTPSTGPAGVGEGPS